ncbi:MAG: AAA family ATPase [Elusimicrobiales bacterium]|nr:AAA family ATPase [Elusimicrobiales bacterium]
MINKIKKYLAQTSLIQLSDILSLYQTPKKLRFRRNWTACCKRHGDKNNEAVYCSLKGEEEPKNYFSKDIKYGYICKSGNLPKINFVNSYNPNNPRFTENYKDNEIIIEAENFEFEPDTTYEIFEKFSDFDYKIAQDIEDNENEYEDNFNRLFKNIKPSQENLLDITNRQKQIDKACDLSKPFLIIQGPPGTGKTSFISDMVVKLIKEKESVTPGDIVCLAQTNRAVDEIKKKLDEYVKKGDIPADIMQDIGEIANDKICISTIHKNPNNNGRIRRKIVLVDEASQISIPVLLYGLRYSRNDSIFRFFGDERQLAPTSSYIRDITKVPNSVNDLENYLEKYNNFMNFLEENISIKFPQIFDQSNLKKVLKDVMVSPFGQSIFSILYFNDPDTQNQIIDGNSLKNIMTCKMICNSNFRHEPEIHNHHKKVFYSDINYETKYNYVDVNLKDISNMEGERRNEFIRHISRDYNKAINFINRFSQNIRNIFDKSTRFIRNLLGFGNNENEKELENINNSISPFQMKTDEDMLKYFKEFFQNNVISNELNSTGLNNLTPEILFNSMKTCLKNKIAIITHNFPQESEININKFEGILSCLLLYLWKNEDYRISNGYGVIVPYRNQECYTTKLYIKAYGKPDIPISDWCATPERFQGRDISRAVYCCVNSNMDSFKEVSTMFSENKLNVATSRASNQQILIVNTNLINRNNIERLKDFANQRQDGDDEKEFELSKKILLEYPVKYLEKLSCYIKEVEDKNENAICKMEII